jgi:hypothetical protein
VAGETPSANTWNLHVRDQLLFLHDNRVSALPSAGTLIDQDEIVYVADAANRRLWRLKFNSSGPAGKQWENVSGWSPLEALVETSENQPDSRVYADFTTTVSLTVPLGGDYIARFGARKFTYNQAGDVFLAPKFGSAATSDNDALQFTPNPYGNVIPGAGRSAAKTLAAADVVKLQVRQSASEIQLAAGKWLEVSPVRVG